MVSRGEDVGGTRVEVVSDTMRDRAVIDDRQICQLRDLGVRVETCMGRPQDVEWVFDETGQLFVLQSRPIVSSVGNANTRIWDNTNIVESYPGVTLPLTFSFVRDGYEQTLRRVALGFTPLKRRLLNRLSIFQNMIGLLNGRVYYNLFNWYELLSLLPGFEKRKASWDRMVGIQERVDVVQKPSSRMDRFFSLIVMVWTLLRVKSTATRFFRHFDAVYPRFRNLDLQTATEGELVTHYRTLSQALLKKWHLTLHIDLCAMTYYGWLKRLCQRWGPADTPNLHNDLLCRDSGVESVAALRSLMSLVGLVQEDPSLRAVFEAGDRDHVWSKIQERPNCAAFRTAVDTHLEIYGDRCPEELKLESPSHREDPRLLIGVIRNHLRYGPGRQTSRHQEEILTRSASAVRASVRNPAKRLCLWFVLRQTRIAVASRENMRFARSRAYGVVRSLFRRLGELFAQKGLLEAPLDICYLTVEEVVGVTQGIAVTQNLKGLVAFRKKEYEVYRKQTMPTG